MPEIRFAGYGGQGIIRAGLIVGKAAALYDNKYATMNQDFGPEARGGACSSQLVISDSRILYPYVTKSDCLIAMSQEGYNKFLPELKEDGLLLIDEDLVKPRAVQINIKIYRIPATRLAEELRSRISANVVMLGFFTAITKFVSDDAMKKAIPSLVPEKAVEINLKAFQRGYDYGLQVLVNK
ncbi:MAG: 2-oxoacid:acceptor oxidoreductase family protein [bacterium]